jgi:hypothetical protein
VHQGTQSTRPRDILLLLLLLLQGNPCEPQNRVKTKHYPEPLKSEHAMPLPVFLGLPEVNTLCLLERFLKRWFAVCWSTK